MYTNNTRQLKIDKKYSAIVDAESFTEVSQIGRWSIVRDANTKRPVPTVKIKVNGNTTSIGLHRYISRAPRGTVVLFLDGDPMNCTRENLLVCTPKQATQIRKLLKMKSK